MAYWLGAVASPVGVFTAHVLCGGGWLSDPNSAAPHMTILSPTGRERGVGSSTALQPETLGWQWTIDSVDPSIALLTAKGFQVSPGPQTDFRTPPSAPAGAPPPYCSLQTSRSVFGFAIHEHESPRKARFAFGGIHPPPYALHPTTFHPPPYLL